MGNTYNFKYSQFGDGSLMINTKEHTSNVLQKEEWEELEAFLELRAKEVKEWEHISFITSKALEYVKKKDVSRYSPEPVTVYYDFFDGLAGGIGICRNPLVYGWHDHDGRGFLPGK